MKSSKMPIVCKMPTSQCSSAKTIAVLKELFAEHVIPEESSQTMDPSLQVTSSPSSQRTGRLSTVLLGYLTYTNHHQGRGHPQGQQPISLIFISHLYNVS